MAQDHLSDAHKTVSNEHTNIVKQENITTYVTAAGPLRAKIEGERPVNETLKNIIDQVKRQAAPPVKDVIDFRNELRERYQREVMEIPTKHLRFRKNNGRIIADVQSYEREHNCILNEETDKAQELLKGFLINNDKERNEELKRLLTMNGQQRPAIATCDGFLINGNRRKMALEELYRTNDQNAQFETMRVILLPAGVSELEIQQIENRYQLQSEGKSEYQGLNRAIKYMHNVRNGFTLEAQLRDDPNYHSMPADKFRAVVKEFEDKFIKPLYGVDRYLEFLGRPGMYNSVSESAGDREGRWQAFIDYNKLYHSVLSKPEKLAQFNLDPDDVGKIDDALFKIIRKRNLTGRLGESPVGKLHEFIRKMPRYLRNPEAAAEILKIADIADDLPEDEKTDAKGNKLTDREIDLKWGARHENEIMQHLREAQRHLTHQETRDMPLELLGDALKKLNHNNLRIGNMVAEYHEKGLELTERIILKAEELRTAISNASMWPGDPNTNPDHG